MSARKPAGCKYTNHVLRTRAWRLNVLGDGPVDEIESSIVAGSEELFSGHGATLEESIDDLECAVAEFFKVGK